MDEVEVSDTVHIEGPACLRGEITPPADKSLSHRAVFLSSLAEGVCRVNNFLPAADPLSTVNAFRMLGVSIEQAREKSSPEDLPDAPLQLIIEGKGPEGLREPHEVIDCGNSGTTMRLLTGVLSGCPFFSVLTGDESLRGRPMGRVIAPLRGMNARIMARAGDRYPPLAIAGRKLAGTYYKLPIASAQLKSALLLAGLFAEGDTVVEEPYASRDHTERMLRALGADIRMEGMRTFLRPGAPLHAMDFTIPGDVSSAAFFIAAALATQGSEILVKNVGLNPTRTGFLDTVLKMGARMSVEQGKEVCAEPAGTLTCSYSANLQAITLGEKDIPSLIDEFPILCVLATQARGITSIRGAAELRVKESDRITAVATGLRAMGARVAEYPDGVDIEGPVALHGAAVDSMKDHRITMAFAVAALIARGQTKILGSSSVDISFPGFFPTLRRLMV